MTELLPMEPCTLISVSQSVAEAQAMLQEGKLAVIHRDGQPLALVQAGRLAQPDDAPDCPLEHVLSRFVSPLLVETTAISSNLSELMMLLDDRNIPGLIVYRDKQIEGIISQKTLADALPQCDHLLPGSEREWLGNPQTPARAYICHKCEQQDPPPPIFLPSQGDSAPICPKHWLHGPMMLLESENE